MRKTYFFFSGITYLFLFLFLNVKSVLLVDSDNRGEEPWVPGYQVCEDKLKSKHIRIRTVIADILTEKLYIVIMQ
jgi:hypothetical protein